MRRYLASALVLVLAVGRGTAGEKGTEVDLGGLKSTTPAEWKLKEGKVPFRLYTFTLPMGEKDERPTELVVSFTGKGSGGDLKPNIQRWQDMFIPPKGKGIEDATKMTEMKVGDVPVTLVDIEGTYKEKFPPFAPMAKVTERPEYRRVNVIFASENGPFFMYLVGPAKTVASHQEAFQKWLKNFK